MIRSLTVALALLLAGGLAAEPVEWQQVADPAAAGWSVEKLDKARAHAKELGSAAVLIVDSGRVVAAWGEVDRRIRSHSLRKSLISALYGVALAENKIDLDATMGQLGIDDLQPLTAGEKQATVRDLITARSGVYHPAAKVTTGQVAKRPARGSYAHGTHWFYNNWDFNVAGVLLARVLGDPGEAFLRWIARPSGMQDFRAGDFYWEPEPRVSRHPAFDFRISARDLARLGEVYRNGGAWRGRRILPASWVKRSLRPVTAFGDGSGYGFMWWINPETSREFGLSGESSGSFAAVGAGAQILFVLPSKNLVIVHRGDTDGGGGVDETRALELIAEIVRAKTGRGSPRAALRPVEEIPLGEPLPPIQEREAIALEPRLMEELPGRWTVSSAMEIEIYAHEGMLFIGTAGKPDTQLVPFDHDRLFSRTLPLTLAIERSNDGRVAAIEIDLKGRRMRAVPKLAEAGSAP